MIHIYGLREDRADVIVPAMQIYINLMRWANIKEIYVPKIDLVDGLVRTLYQEVRPNKYLVYDEPSSCLRIVFNSFWRSFVIVGYAILSSLNRIKDNLGNNQTGILLIIGRDDIPRVFFCTCCVQAILISLHVLRPVFSFVNVREAKFPVFVGLFDALKESLALFFLR